MEFELEDWSVVKKIFVNLNEIIDEIVIECNPEGLKFNALDKSHVCFMGGYISKKFFDSYDIDRILFLYVDVNDFVKILKRGNKKDTLVFKADKEVIDVIFKNKNNRTFTLTQLDMEDNSREMPSMNYTVNFECEFDTILNCLKDAELYSEVLEFNLQEDLLILSCDGQFGNYKNECLLDNVNYVSDNQCSAQYGVDWLLRIFNSKLNSNNLKIHMGDDYPMLVELDVENIKINYLLAPRMSNDE